MLKSKESHPSSLGLSGKHTVDSLNEELGMTRHHWQAMLVGWVVFFLAGWVYSLSPYLLEAVGMKQTNWVDLSSESQRMTDSQKSLAMLLAGVTAMVGNPVFGYISDSKGRIVTILIGLGLMSTAIVGFAYVRDWRYLVACMCVAPFGRDGTGPVAQSLLAEWAPMEYRGFAIAIGHCTFNVARLALTLLWLVMPPHYNWTGFFMSAAAVPWTAFVILAIVGWKYESPRWLAVIGDRTRCAHNLHLAAESGGHTMPDEWNSAHNFQIEGEEMQSRPKNQHMDLRMIGMRKDFIILSMCAFCLGFASWGSFLWTIDYLKAVEAEGAIKTVMTLTPIGKIFTNIFIVTPMPGGRGTPMNCFGRLAIMKTGFVGCGFFMMLLYCCGHRIGPIVAVTFLSQMFEEAVWTAQSTYMMELFPTSMRTYISSCVWVFSSLGGILANSTGLRMLRYWQYLPMVTMGTLMLVGGALCFLLPEDRTGKPLIETSKSHENLFKAGKGVTSYETCDEVSF